MRLLSRSGPASARPRFAGAGPAVVERRALQTVHACSTSRRICISVLSPGGAFGAAEIASGTGSGSETVSGTLQDREPVTPRRQNTGRAQIPRGEPQ